MIKSYKKLTIQGNLKGELNTITLHKRQPFLDIFCIVVFLFSNSTFASKLEEAENTLTKAKNDYYRALVSGSNLTTEEKHKIREKILTPAIEDVTKALNEANEKFASKYVKILSQEEFDKTLADAEREAESLKEDHLSSNSFEAFWNKISAVFKEDEKPPERKLASADDKTSPKLLELKEPATFEEYVIDGKDVPKEIEFKTALQKKEGEKGGKKASK